MVRYSKQDVLNEQERMDLVNACKNKKELFVVQGLLYTGMRAGEFAHLRESWIDWQKETLYVPRSQDLWKPKNKAAAREIPMVFEVKRLFYDYFRENKETNMSRVTVFRIVRQVGKRLRPFKKVYPHSLRATFASMMAANGVPASDIQAIMGWAKLETANSYVRATKAIETFREKMKEVK